MSIGKKQANPKPEKKVRYEHVPVIFRIWMLPVFALCVTILVEGFNKGSTAKLLWYIVNRPLYFMYNWLIVLTTLTFSELFKRRKSALAAIMILWCAAGIGNFIVIKTRTQPFCFNDILMVGDAITLTPIYYTIPQIIAMYGSILLGLIAAIVLLTKLPKRRKVNHTISLSVFTALMVLCVLLRTVGIGTGFFPRYYNNMVEAYDQYGFSTCFAFTFGWMGVTKPADYSTETVTGIMDEAVPEATEAPRHIFTKDDNLQQPNIIFVQLESFFDVNNVVGATYSKEPTPNFTEILKEWPNGELYMQSIGGGTANSEFEVLTGFALDFFGAGEYPYSTVLKEKACDSLPFYLLNQGYATTAMHNSTATFYSRNEVYPRLGFEKFVSVEYMPYVNYTEVGWAQDIILADEIVKAMKATPERDFVMAITVESHGKYEETYEYTEDDARILTLPEQLNEPVFAHYMHLIRETDNFLRKLLDSLAAYEEPVVCVFYGDHLPSLNLTSDILKTGNLYASRYVVWNNYGAEFTAPNIEAYRLSANLLKDLGMPGGPVSRFHQSYDPTCADEDYLGKLSTLEYDLLYGDQAAYGDAVPEPVELTMGSVPIEITSVSNQYQRVLVNGKNFTEFSTIYLDGTAYPTAFVSAAQIVCIVPKNTVVSEVRVAQIASDGAELSSTEVFRLGH